ncbi:fibronectin type III domain-containing protein [Rathayibacter sp. VKM Ac-2630]|uniref:fibronectin type III domain-containing protein n=1 Tax=Rathayibacter sp. VKM Ac-2630 TaxID=1938617 RepID=UPI000981BBEA|nr:fibronectin type III domain-containing protein [Rathayibacter sp. VKM Ac-2630]OOB90993.1 hypothetical protein B0T42_08515 [Rathayibacter sp. VKM Ac-2630]
MPPRTPRLARLAVIVVAALLLAFLPAAPASAATAFTTAPTPTISGTAAVGSVLTAKTGTWNPVPTSYAYQWKRSGTAITGATAATYKAVTADSGRTLTVTVTGSRTGYTTTPRTSAPTATITTPRAFTTAPTPTVTGTTRVGSVLTAKTGTWNPVPTSYAYQWKRSGTAITGATAATYKAVTADSGRTLTVTVTGSRTGYTTTPKTSAPTATIKPGPPGAATSVVAVVDDAAATATISWQPPATTGGSAITGYRLTRDGVDSTGQGAWSHLYGPEKRSVTHISLVPGGTYSLTVTPVNAVGSGPTTARSVTLAPKVLVAPTPTVSGTPTVYSLLTANAGTWSSGWRLEYRWYANGAAIKDSYGEWAAAPTLRTDIAQSGTRVTVRVTGTRTGYAPVVRESAATTTISPRDVFDLATIGHRDLYELSPRGARVYTISRTLDLQDTGEGEAPVRWTAEAGTIIKVYDGIAANLPLKASGTSTAPVVVTSIHDDTVGGDTDGTTAVLPARATPWKGIDVFEQHYWYDEYPYESTICRMDAQYLVVKYAETGVFCGQSESAVRISHSQIWGGVRLRGTSVDLQDNEFVRGRVYVSVPTSEPRGDWLPPEHPVIVRNNVFTGMGGLTTTPIEIHDALLKTSTALAGNTAPGMTNPHILLARIRASDSLILGQGWVHDIVSGSVEYWKVDGTLVVQPGVVVRLAEGSFVRGTISAVGTPSQPITFTSTLDDTIGTARPSGPAPVIQDAAEGACSFVEGFTSSSVNYTVRPMPGCL